MKFDFDLNQQDYERAYLELSKKHFLFAFLYFLGFSLFVSYLNYLEDYKWGSYGVSYLFIFFLVVVLWVIPSYRNYNKSLKIINSNPDFFGFKSFELTKEGLISSNQNKSSYYKWKDMKRIHSTKNYGFVILRNNLSILFKNDNNEIVKKIKEYKRNYSSR